VEKNDNPNELHKVPIKDESSLITFPQKRAPNKRNSVKIKTKKEYTKVLLPIKLQNLAFSRT
jgi:hypothetical protein